MFVYMAAGSILTTLFYRCVDNIKKRIKRLSGDGWNFLFGPIWWCKISHCCDLYIQINRDLKKSLFQVVKLMERVEAAFIKHFANANHRQGMRDLRPRAKRDKHRLTFFIGNLIAKNESNVKKGCSRNWLLKFSTN